MAINKLNCCHSIEKIVQLINDEMATDASAEAIAAEYAWNGSKESGYEDDANIEAQLMFLSKAGAEFDFEEALTLAIKEKKDSRPVAVQLDQYINEEFFGSQKHFAEAQGVAKAQVTQWLKKDFIVVDDVMYSARRELNNGRKI